MVGVHVGDRPRRGWLPPASSRRGGPRLLCGRCCGVALAVVGDPPGNVYLAHHVSTISCTHRSAFIVLDSSPSRHHPTCISRPYRHAFISIWVQEYQNYSHCILCPSDRAATMNDAHCLPSYRTPFTPNHHASSPQVLDSHRRDGCQIDHDGLGMAGPSAGAKKKK